MDLDPILDYKQHRIFWEDTRNEGALVLYADTDEGLIGDKYSYHGFSPSANIAWMRVFLSSSVLFP